MAPKGGASPRELEPVGWVTRILNEWDRWRPERQAWDDDADSQGEAATGSRRYQYAAGFLPGGWGGLHPQPQAGTGAHSSPDGLGPVEGYLGHFDL